MAARRRTSFAGVVVTAVVVMMLLPGESSNERLSLEIMKHPLVNPQLNIAPSSCSNVRAGI